MKVIPQSDLACPGLDDDRALWPRHSLKLLEDILGGLLDDSVSGPSSGGGPPCLSPLSLCAGADFTPDR
jgi:hypothetical protein